MPAATVFPVTEKQRDLRLESWSPGTDPPHRKPFVTEASVLKIEGRMFDKCDGPGIQLQPPGSLSKGNRSLLWTEMESEQQVG